MWLVRRLQPILWVASAIAVAYCAWVFTGRIFERRRLDQKVHNQGKNPEFDRVYGGDTVRILQYYAREGVVRRGESTLLCYGVLNATTVRIEPPIDGVYPAMNRCLEITPRQTTDYSLTAEGPKGPPATQTLKVVVR